MFGSLYGTIIRTNIGGSVIIDVHGVGYLVHISDMALTAIGDSSSARLMIETHVRESAIELFGFIDQEEKAVFNQLIKISGISGKLAMSILSYIKFEDICQLILAKDSVALTRVPNVGSKLANRIIIEMSDYALKQGKSAVPAVAECSSLVLEDIVAGLARMGYSKSDAKELCARVYAQKPEIANMDIEDAIKLMLLCI